MTTRVGRMHDRIISLGGEVRIHRTTLIQSLFIGVLAPCQESERSCICVLGVMYMCVRIRVYVCVRGHVYVCWGSCICVQGIVYMCARGRVYVC